MRTNKTMLSHPTFMEKIRDAMVLTLSGEGDKMNGHGTRAYIQNRNGRNVLRCDYDTSVENWVFYGDCSINFTAQVMQAVREYELALSKAIK